MGFLDATRQSIRTPLTATYSSGGRSVIQLPRTGLLSRIYIHVNGTHTVTIGTGSATISSKGPFNLLRDIQLKANQGVDIIRMDGYMAHIADVVSAGKKYEHDDGDRAAAYATRLFQAGVANGANTWDFNLQLNVTPNERDPQGLVLLQTDQMAAELILDWAPINGTTFDSPVVLTGDTTSTFTGTAKIYLETFSLPANPQDQPDIQTVYQQLQRVDPVSAVGEQSIKLLRANVYARLIHSLELNAALNTVDMERFRLRYNGADTPYDIDNKTQLHLQRRRYGRDLPVGCFIHDFFYQGIPGFGGARDLVNAAAVTELESLLDVASGATLGSGNNKIYTVQQQFVRLPEPQR